jgi:hypothetical protein
VKHVDLDKVYIRIDQRNWRGNIDEPRTAKSKRVLALGDLGPRYKIWIGKLNRRGPEASVFPQADNLNEPMWDSGVRQALKRAANAESCDFPGFGPHSLPPRQHHVAAGSRRQQHRNQQDRRSRQHEDHGGVYDSSS